MSPGIVSINGQPVRRSEHAEESIFAPLDEPLKSPEVVVHHLQSPDFGWSTRRNCGRAIDTLAPLFFKLPLGQLDRPIEGNVTIRLAASSEDNPILVRLV
jgi:hypothetical protein